MDKITQEPDGSFRWDCPIEREYHQRAGRQGLAGVLILCAFVFIVSLAVSHGTDFRTPLIVTGVILVTALPLLYFWNSAEDPHEQYMMTEEYVKSGYGKGALFSEFKKTKDVTVTAKYIELAGKHRNNRIYVPPEDMDFVRDFILERLPDDAVIRRR